MVQSIKTVGIITFRLCTKGSVLMIVIGSNIFREEKNDSTLLTCVSWYRLIAFIATRFDS